MGEPIAIAYQRVIVSGNEPIVTRWRYPPQAISPCDESDPRHADKVGFVHLMKPLRPELHNRRSFIITAAAAGACLAPLLKAAGALAQPADIAPFERTPLFETELKKLLAGAVPTDGKITVDLPEMAENGNFVPITMSVDSPMTDADHVRAIHILSSGNPVAHVATFRLSPLNGRARVQSRMRLARSQDVVVLAELSNGEITMSTMTVKVTLGGCQT